MIVSRRLNIPISAILLIPTAATAHARPAGEAAAQPIAQRQEAAFRQAAANASLAAEALFRCRRYVDGWLAQADPATGLIPRNLNADRDLWNGRDAAADNYPFMVLTAALTDRPLFEGRMRAMLDTETRLTARVDRLGDHYRFSTRTFAHPSASFERIAFDNAEYVKDGLIPLTEWLGPSPWSDRMVDIVEDLWKHAATPTPAGPVPTLEFEVAGDLLQANSRLFWFTGRREFLDQAIRLGDHYLLGGQHPTRDRDELRLIDHGCEVVNGLSELYVAVARAAPEKREAYRKPLHALYDRILEAGRNEHGLLYSSFNPRTGAHGPGLCDTWGYVYDGVYTVALLDDRSDYRDAVRHVLESLEAYSTGRRWEGGVADGYADAIEGALNLYNREPIPSAARWIDGEIRDMWAIQKPDGVIEGWHGDGNFARTSLMYALWKTQGVHVEPWRPDVRIGAERDGESLCLSLAADAAWEGRIVFDRPRHREFLHLPFDYPRINQFPEWFTVDREARYTVRNLTRPSADPASGAALRDGLPVRLDPGQELRLRVEP